MKKTYFKPEIEVYELPKQVILAGSSEEGADDELLLEDSKVEGDWC